MAGFLPVLLLLQVVCLHGFLLEDVSDVVTVTSRVGTIMGLLKPYEFEGSRYYVKEYLGIPYAESPTGDRRFRKPVPKANFTHSFHAFDFGPSCLQLERVLGGEMASEDCLFLNIFAPERSNATSNIPVMVWIHGGWFQMGSSTYYDAGVLSAFGDVVVVTMNYRLAHLGFLRVDDDTGNFGLWDQHLAIKWVKDNIASFGGDTSNITICGESAGSVSVAYQTLFAGNKGLFHRAVAQSGSITSQWGFSTNTTAARQFDEFSASLDCNGTHAQILTCLRQKSSNEIKDAINKVNFYDVVLPTRDSDFVPQHPIDMLKDSSENSQSHEFFRSLDLIMGSTNFDGALFLFYFAAELNATSYDNLTIPRNRYESDFIPDILADVFDNVVTIPKIVEDLTVFEYTHWEDPDSDKERLKALLDLSTHAAVLAPTVSTVQLHSQGATKGGRTYMFRFSTRRDMSDRLTGRFPSWLDGPDVSMHGEDVLFVFGFSDRIVYYVSEQQANVTNSNLRTSKAMMTMWSNFAKTGNPNEPRNITQYLPVEWQEYTMTSQNYLDVTPVMTKASVKQNIEAEKMQFWLKYLPSFFP